MISLALPRARVMRQKLVSQRRLKDGIGNKSPGASLANGRFSFSGNLLMAQFTRKVSSLSRMALHRNMTVRPIFMKGSFLPFIQESIVRTDVFSRRAVSRLSMISQVSREDN